MLPQAVWDISKAKKVAIPGLSYCKLENTDFLIGLNEIHVFYSLKASILNTLYVRMQFLHELLDIVLYAR
jgi:hypothetical protein